MPKMSFRDSRRFKKAMAARYMEDTGRINQEEQENFNEFTAHHNSDYTAGMDHLVGLFDQCLAGQRKLSKMQSKVVATKQKEAAGYELGFFEKRRMESREKKIRAAEQKLSRQFASAGNQASMFYRNNPDDPFYMQFVNRTVTHKSPHETVVGDGTLYGQDVMRDLGIEVPNRRDAREVEAAERQRFGAAPEAPVNGEQRNDMDYDDPNLVYDLQEERQDTRRMNRTELNFGTRQNEAPPERGNNSAAVPAREDRENEVGNH